jgi:carboxypeptidase family protein/matrixin
MKSLKALGLVIVPAAMALGLAIAAPPVQAMVLQTVDIDGKPAHPRWAENDMPVFKLNDRPFNLLPNLSRTSAPMGAIEAAAKSWAIGPVHITLNGTTASNDIAADGVNLLTFADSPRNRELTANAWAGTMNWSKREGDHQRMIEADIVMSPAQVFSTTGLAEEGDLQGILAHEFGHVLGEEHSPDYAATMFPGGEDGQFTLRTLDPDDVAGIRALYLGDTGPTYGALSGHVQAANGAPVFGAHVTAVDAEGIVQAGGLTDRDGNFTIPGLAPGAYQAYAEPLDLPMVPGDLGDAYFHDRMHPINVTFRTGFFGGNATPRTAKVEAAKTTALEPIVVDASQPGINPIAFLWTDDFKYLHSLVAPIRLGQPLYFFLVGYGLERVPSPGFRVSSPGIAIDYSSIERGVFNNGTPYIQFTFQLAPRTPPGARSVYLAVQNERAALTGVIEPAS